LADDETTRPTHHHKLRVARAREASGDLVEQLLPWLLQARIPSDDEVRAGLQIRVAEYVPAPASQRSERPGREPALPMMPPGVAN